jgi:hypothetical protein
MDFDPACYGPDVARILALDENGNRLIPLRWSESSNQEARDPLNTLAPSTLFRQSLEPTGAMAGLWFYFDGFDNAHQLADSRENANGYYWHAMVHRREGDPENAAYWFRKTRTHPIYQPLATEAANIIREFPGAEFRVSKWDPYAFVMFHERAQQQPGTEQERAALHIPRAEWQLLFDYCAQRGGARPR